VAAWKQSGQSGADYAHQHGLNENTFAWWRWQLGRERAQPVQPPKRPTLTLVPVTTTPTQPPHSDIELALPDGIVVRVHEHVDPQRVAALVRALVTTC